MKLEGVKVGVDEFKVENPRQITRLPSLRHLQHLQLQQEGKINRYYYNLIVLCWPIDTCCCTVPHWTNNMQEGQYKDSNGPWHHKQQEMPIRLEANSCVRYYMPLFSLASIFSAILLLSISSQHVNPARRAQIWTTRTRQWRELRLWR